MSEDSNNEESKPSDEAVAKPVEVQKDTAKAESKGAAPGEKKAEPGAETVSEKEGELSAAAMLAPDAPDREAGTKKRRGKSGKHVPVGLAFVKATFNNTMVTITDLNGNVVSWSSGGRCGFKGSRKSTAFAASTVSQDAARQASAQGMREVQVRVQGPGAGRESAIRGLQSSGLTVTAIMDVTPIPHNGCRPPKRRRV